MAETLTFEYETRSASSHAHSASSPGTVYPAITSLSAPPGLSRPSVPFANHAERKTAHARGKYPARAKSNSLSVLP